jgi:hypothetical protein
MYLSVNLCAVALLVSRSSVTCADGNERNEAFGDSSAVGSTMFAVNVARIA